MEESYIISDGKGCTYGLSYCGKFIASFDRWIEAINWINENMKMEQFYPDVFYVNERGAIDQLDYTGRIIF